MSAACEAIAAEIAAFIMCHMFDLSAVRFTKRVCNDVTLHVAEAGPGNGPLVILLHGFPEFWFGWRYQIAALVSAGFHVVMPDQRGYDLSDKPVGIANYDVDKLAGDVVALAAHYTNEPFRLVGHDWGAVAAWWTTTRFSQKVRTLCVLNCPHPAIWRDAMDNDPVQRRASWYVRVFSFPWLPEMMMRSGNFRALVGAIRGSKTPVSEDEANEYRRAWAQPGALTAMINWYRAILKRKFEPIAPGNIAVPVHIIWGQQDPYALPALAEASKALCANATLTFLPEATHWVAHDEPERVNAIILEALKA
ncbi:MAG: alpha/beta fold hydrolase [Rhizomicrobium sp.]